MQGFPALRKAVTTHVKRFYYFFTSVWYRQSAADTSLAFRATRPGQRMNGEAFTIHNHSLFFLYDKQNNTCLFADMKFFFSCSTRHLNRSLLPLVSYRVKRSLSCIVRYLIFIPITLSADLMLPIFWFYFVIFLLLSCWISSGNSLIWIFVTFVITIEVVSFWLGLFILVILIKDYLKCVIAMPQYKLLIYLLLYQINILILTRVIMEMTKMQATGDNQSQQLRWKRALN